ncbi:MAG: hypothetical protein Q4C42_02725 [Clostridia bacterium]|nr:hypothetical protein [Clostridia bacterium]
MKKLISVMFILIFAFSLCGCSVVEKFTGGGKTVGAVEVVSGGISFETYEVKTADYGKKSAVYDYDVDYVKNSLNVTVPYNQDFVIQLEGERTGNVSYSLYDENFAPYYENNSFMTLPSSSGNWICKVSVNWGDENEFSSYDYFFRLTRAEEN